MEIPTSMVSKVTLDQQSLDIFRRDYWDIHSNPK